jgi:hypothetical protein
MTGRRQLPRGPSVGELALALGTKARRLGGSL